MPSKNRYLEAFKENYNTVGLTVTAALSFATLTPFPFLVGLVAEAAYLLIVPDTKWYEQRLSRRFDAEVEARRQKMKEETLAVLRPEMRERFLKLEETRRQIDAQSQEDQSWFREVVRKLDYLLEKFLVFAAKEVQFRNYLQALREEIHGDKQTEPEVPWRGEEGKRFPRSSNSVPRRPLRNVEPEDNRALSGDRADRWAQKAVEEIQAFYEQERKSLEKLMETEQDEDTKHVLEKRTEVLQRRDEFTGKIGKILSNINHQLQLVEDTFGLTNDEIRARSPEQILADVEEVVLTTNTMATALEELAPIEQMIARASH